MLRLRLRWSLLGDVANECSSISSCHTTRFGENSVAVGFVVAVAVVVVVGVMFVVVVMFVVAVAVGVGVVVMFAVAVGVGVAVGVVFVVVDGFRILGTLGRRARDVGMNAALMFAALRVRPTSSWSWTGNNLCTRSRSNTEADYWKAWAKKLGMLE